jgi:tripartite-type tricarboxylate transporter receptor subunit TctC
MRSCLGFIVATMLMAAGVAQAQSAENFYSGKTLRMIIGYPPGGANDLYARAVARHIGSHIPGHPSVVIQNMPGAGTLTAANHLYNSAAKDGTVIGLVAATIPLEAALGEKNVKLQADRYSWIGRVSASTDLVFTWHTSPVKTIADAMKTQAVLAATGASSPVTIYPEVLNKVVGTKFKLVLGYTGSAAAMLAMERGEAEGHTTSYDGMNAAHPDWVRDKKINILVQIAINRDPRMKTIPTMIELGKTDEDKKVLRVVASASEIGKSVLAPPDVPQDRVAVLRHAFDDMVNDPDFVRELQTVKLTLDPMNGQNLSDLVAEVGHMPPSVFKRVKEVYLVK